MDTLKPVKMGPLMQVEIDKLLDGVKGAVRREDREGVYVHSFKCFGCGLHFATFSWLAQSHRVGTIACPECGQKEYFGHWRTTLNASPHFDPQAHGFTEIYRVLPWPGSALLNDSKLPPNFGE